MASAVDATIPADNVKASKADFRAQLLIIKNELTALQVATSVPARQAFESHVSEIDVARIVRRLTAETTYARDHAFGRIPLDSMDVS